MEYELGSLLRGQKSRDEEDHHISGCHCDVVTVDGVRTDFFVFDRHANDRYYDVSEVLGVLEKSQL